MAIDPLLLSVALPACRGAYAAEVSRDFPLPAGYALVDLINVAPVATAHPLVAVMQANSDVFGFVAASADTILVAFRGTQIPGEWVEDLEACPVANQNGPGRVHYGFQAVYMHVRAKVWSILNGLWSKPNMIVTGHSLGGAIAQQCGLDVAIHRVPVTRPKVFTFEAPAVAGMDLPLFTCIFRDEFEARCDSLRVANVWDSVNGLPFPPTFKQSRPVLAVNGGRTSSVLVAHSLDADWAGLRALATAE
jgi:Lipase (class 3)